MNSDYDDLVTQLQESVSSSWATETPAAVYAYDNDLKEKAASVTKEEHVLQAINVNSSVALAGARSIALAITCCTRKSPPAVQKLAEAVLKDWGIENPDGAPLVDDENMNAIHDPEPLDSTDPAPVVTKDTMVWPPPVPSLPPIYTENFYVLRDDATAYMENPGEMNFSFSFTLTQEAFPEGTKFVFSGQSEYGFDTWWMRMTRVRSGEALRAPDHHCWVSSKKLKPTVELVL